MFLSGEKVEGEKYISAQSSSVKGSSQQSSTSGPKVKGGGPLFSSRSPLIGEGAVGKWYYTGNSLRVHTKATLTDGHLGPLPLDKQTRLKAFYTQLHW